MVWEVSRFGSDGRPRTQACRSLGA